MKDATKTPYQAMRGFRLSPAALLVMQAQKSDACPQEDAFARYNRLYSNVSYCTFRDNAEYYLQGNWGTAVDLLTDSALELCYLHVGDTPPAYYKGKIQQLAAFLKNEGTDVNLSALEHLKLFHPDALAIYFQRPETQEKSHEEIVAEIMAQYAGKEDETEARYQLIQSKKYWEKSTSEIIEERRLLLWHVERNLRAYDAQKSERGEWS